LVFGKQTVTFLPKFFSACNSASLRDLSVEVINVQRTWELLLETLFGAENPSALLEVKVRRKLHSLALLTSKPIFNN
jgi:hypothetical protein